MSTQEMLERANLVFVGVIEEQHFDRWPPYRLALPESESARSQYWRLLRRRVRIEMILRGVETRKVIDVYEIFWTGATSGDWNLTQNGERDLFMVRLENGRYHVVRDWWRSIFPVTSGPHQRLPLNESHPLWERFALMNWWIPRSDVATRITHPYFNYDDPGWALSQWRTVKLERGLVRHPSAGVRVPACRELLLLRGWGQDECWEMLSETDRAHLSDGGYFCCTPAEIAATRKKTEEDGATWWWSTYSDRESRRLLTAISNSKLRAQFCQWWEDQYSEDRENGCPSNQPPPATIVTEDGDLPLLGAWPLR